MAISHSAFESESELQKWAFTNCSTFFGSSLMLPGFRITTPTGKHGVPDGFAFNLKKRQWWVVECELLDHGVWPHIAEQITRFVVALRNPSTLRQVRDKLFEHILSQNLLESALNALETDGTRLLQQVELFVESVAPSMAIVIDDTNQDLIDFCNALEIPAEVYRVRKFIVNGVPEYYSPDRNQPIVITDTEPGGSGGSSTFDVIELLGGGEVISGKHRCYRLRDGRVVKVQYSKFHEPHQAFWYGINPSSYSQVKELGCSYFIFVLGNDGFVVVPLSVVDTYIAGAYTTLNSDGEVRHYHVHITPPPSVRMKGYGGNADLDLSKYFRAFG